jgi:hypothetical protein
MLSFVSESLLYLAKEEVYFFMFQQQPLCVILSKIYSFRIILAKVTVFFSLYSDWKKYQEIEVYIEWHTWSLYTEYFKNVPWEFF